MKNSAKKRAVFLTFHEALEPRAPGKTWDLATGEFFLDDPYCQAWVKKFVQKHRPELEQLYLKHRVPPSVVLEQIALVDLSDVPAVAPAMVRNRKALLESAARIEQTAEDFKLFSKVSGPLHGVPGELCLTHELGDELIKKAAVIRSMAGRSARHRPRNVKFTEMALYLTDVFLQHTGQPLWDYTGRLIIEHAVANPTDSVKKAVHAAIKRNPHGSIEKRVSARLSK